MTAPLRMLFKRLDMFDFWHIGTDHPIKGSHRTMCGIVGFGKGVPLDYATNEKLPEGAIHGDCIRAFITHRRPPMTDAEAETETRALLGVGAPSGVRPSSNKEERK